MKKIKPRFIFEPPPDDELVDVPKEELGFELWWDIGNGIRETGKILMAKGKSFDEMSSDEVMETIKEVCRHAWKAGRQEDGKDKH